MKKFYFFITFLCISTLLFADVRLPKIFGDNMVLQRGRLIPLWGWADANENVTIKFNHQTKTAKADSKGNWKINLDKEIAGGPYQLTVSGKNTITYNDVMVGDVWICSGQSNMEFHVSSAINADKEIADANYPNIRHIKIPNTVSATPKDDVPDANWQVCSPQTVGDFTAVGYFFARELYNQLKVPIGLINTSWGGTHVETWTSRQAFENDAEFKSMIATMPSLNLDSIAELKKAASLKKILDLQGSLEKTEVTEAWKNTDVRDSNWLQMKLPGLWEQQQQQLSDVDGIVWFRKTINLSAADVAKAATLELSMIDDADSTYINGVLVGATNGYNLKRKYSIAAGMLKEGKNIIAVRVLDTGGGGGIYGDSSDLKLTIGDSTISLADNWKFRVAELASGSSSVGPNSYPTLLFNAMVNPLIPYAIKGALWYQGESNAGRSYQYRKSFPLMISDWRKRWNQGNFPFYFVQLASYNASNGTSKNGSGWAELREAQTTTLALPNTGMAVITDIGESHDIHPKNKQDVGKRLAGIALHNDYRKSIVYGSPMYKSMKTSGNKISIYFTNIGGGLVSKNGELKGFEIAGEDKIFYPAKAIIERDHVVVYSNNVSKPAAVRFGWADDAGEDNLFNKEGFPASPFRTDKWKGVTDEIKYAVGM